MKPFIALGLLFFGLLALAPLSFGQIGIGGPPHPAAVLDLKSPNNNKVLLPPRLTTTQRNAIASPAVGLMVFDVDKNTVYLYDGQNWLPLSASTDPGLIPPINRTASDGAEYDQFGLNVGISGDYAITGATTKTIGNNAIQGGAYIFNRPTNSSFTEQQRLIATDGAANDKFGYSVAISGDYAIVGAPVKTVNTAEKQGAAYLFVRTGTTWTQQQRITALDGAAQDQFGYSVAISGDYAVVGTPYKTVNNKYAQGAAYVFVRNSGSNIWVLQQKLTVNDGAEQDNFGFSVGISGDYILVGSVRKTINTNYTQGAAYVFVRSGNGWTQQQRLTAGDGAAGDYFGSSVAISGAYVLVGAWYKTINGKGSQGAAYTFARNGTAWTQQSQLTASDGNAFDYFGGSVSIAGDYAIVGAGSHTDGSNASQGAAYLYTRMGATWSQLRRVTSNDPAYTQAGYGVGLANGSYIIGGPGYQNFKGKVAFGTVD